MNYEGSRLSSFTPPPSSFAFRVSAVNYLRVVILDGAQEKQQADVRVVGLLKFIKMSF